MLFFNSIVEPPLLYLILSIFMIQMQTQRTENLFMPKVIKQKNIHKDSAIKIGKTQVRDFLKRKGISNKAKYTVNSATAPSLIRHSSTKTQRVQLFDLLDQSRCSCPVCLEILVRPTLLECGHVVCLQCFEEYSNFALRCSVCRSQLTSPIQIEFKALDRWTKNRIEVSSQEGVEFWCRQGDFEDWECKRRVRPWELNAGDALDFWTVKGWHQATFKAIFSNKNKQLTIRVVLNLKGQIVLEIELPAHSRKLAPAGFFTKGQYKTARNFNRVQKFTKAPQIPEINPSDVKGFMSRRQSFSFLKEEAEPTAQHLNQIMVEGEGESLKEFALQLFDFEMNISELGFR